MTSKPRFWNFAILASVPASTMTLVRTLWAWRLYRGMIMRRVEVDDALEATVEKEVTEE